MWIFSEQHFYYSGREAFMRRSLAFDLLLFFQCSLSSILIILLYFSYVSHYSHSLWRSFGHCHNLSHIIYVVCLGGSPEFFLGGGSARGKIHFFTYWTVVLVCWRRNKRGGADRAKYRRAKRAEKIPRYWTVFRAKTFIFRKIELFRHQNSENIDYLLKSRTI